MSTFDDKTDMHNDERISMALHIASYDEFVSELENGVMPSLFNLLFMKKCDIIILNHSLYLKRK